MSTSDESSAESETEDREDDERAGEEYEVERLVTREAGAAALRRLAAGVANGSVELGDDEVTATVPERFELDVEYEQASEGAELEVEREWPTVDGEAVVARHESEAQGDDTTEETEMGGDDAAIDGVEEAQDFGNEDGFTAGGDVGKPPDEAIGAGDAASNAGFELYRDRAEEWRLVHDNGNIIADSGEGYDRIATARNGLESVMRNAPGATVVETDD